jgi:F0F1-type ATP synthase membrane subunit c/vacuolar-type H+-ATPase subunit K
MQLVLGMPPLLPHGTSTGSGPLPCGNTSGLPFTANFTGGRKNEEMSLRTIIIIAVSSVIVLFGMVGIFYIIFKWRKTRRPSSDLDLQFTLSPNMRSGTISIYFCNLQMLI